MTPSPARPQFTAAQRLRCFEDHGAIVLCQSPGCDSAMYIKGCDIDHWLALVDGGRHVQENFRPICTACHAKKSALEHKRNAKAKRLAAARLAPLHVPRAPKLPRRPWPSRKMQSRPFPKRLES